MIPRRDDYDDAPNAARLCDDPREGSQQQSAVGRFRRGRVVRAEGRGVSETLSLSFAAATGVASRDTRARATR